jgi:hypothetical protein
MTQLDKAAYKAGLFMTGDDYRIELMSSTAPVVYGQPLPSADLTDIARRLDVAKKRLDEIRAAVRRR